MKVFISTSRDYSEYDFAVYTGARARTIKTSKGEFKLSKGDIFGYRDGRGDSVYIVLQSAGLKKEFRIDGNVFDDKIADHADSVTRSKAKKAFEEGPKVTARPKAPVVKPPVAPEPPAKTPVVPRPPAGTELPKPKAPTVSKVDKDQAEQEAEESKLVQNYGDSIAWKRVKSKPGMIAYATAVFNKLNAKHGRDLLMPHFEIMKDMGANFKRRGAIVLHQLALFCFLLSLLFICLRHGRCLWLWHFCAGWRPRNNRCFGRRLRCDRRFHYRRFGPSSYFGACFKSLLGLCTSY
jgi:hypothetical protein